MSIKFGRLNPQRMEQLAPYLKGKTVYDLGCGSGATHAKSLLTKCSKLYCVDQHMKDHDQRGYGFYGVRKEFKDLEPLSKDTVAFISWPETGGIEGLLEAMEHCETVIVLAACDGRVRCGSTSFWFKMMEKEPVLVDHGAYDHMIVYQGKRDRKENLPVEEFGLWWREHDPNFYKREKSQERLFQVSPIKIPEEPFMDRADVFLDFDYASVERHALNQILRHRLPTETEATESLTKNQCKAKRRKQRKRKRSR